MIHGQLPPINKDDDNHLLDAPHIFLDEIMRQAAESEIIQLSMKIRAGEPIPYMKGKEVQVIKKEELSTGMLLWADQILCATNRTRVDLNNQMRELLGRGEKPEDGDKVICLRNYWENLSENEESALVNGTIGYLKNCYDSFFLIPQKLKPNVPRIDIINADFVSDTNETFPNLVMDKKLILEGENSLDWKTSFKLNKSEFYSYLVPKEFTYGYAITRS